jgi:Ca-activated chloride channel family protein
VTFEWPLVLIALVLVPVVIALYVLRERRRNDYAARFTTPTLLPNLVAAAPGWRRHLPLALLLVGLTALVVGVARPHASVDVRREEATVIIVIDTSLSMKAQDVRPSRLGAAENAANAFVAELPKRFRVGVIGFSGRAYLGLAPTEDRELVVSALRSLRPGEGTALGDAVALGVRLARQERASDGTIPPTAMLVISDGAQMSGSTSPATAALKAVGLHIPVYSVVVGTPDGVVNVPIAGGRYQEQLRVPPSPETLKTLAQVTGGQFFTAPDQKRLSQIHERLGSRLGHRRETREVTDLFAGGSAAFLLVGGALSSLWFRRVP